MASAASADSVSSADRDAADPQRAALAAVEVQHADDLVGGLLSARST